VKTTVDLPDELFGAARQYATAHGKTIRQVLVESLKSFIGSSADVDSRPGREKHFGAFEGDPEIDDMRAFLDREFSHIDLTWK
jgi:hypothetical protein